MNSETPKPQGKSPRRSKIIIVNVLAAIIALVTALADQSWVMENPRLVSLFTLALTLLNVFLRYFTVEAIEPIKKTANAMTQMFRRKQ